MAQVLAQDLFNVNGMVAVITGGGTGLGLYAARALDANGAKAVYITGRREEALKAAAKTAKNGNIIPIVGDVTDKASLAAVAERVREEQGYVNFLFANAGVSNLAVRKLLPQRAEGEKLTIEDFQAGMWGPEMDDFTKVLHVNCTGAFYTMVAFLDLLEAGNKKRNVAADSQILVTSSIASFSRNVASSFAYSTSKAAVTHLTKMMSTYCSQNKFRIRCNTLIPGLYPSEMTDGTMKTVPEYKGPEGHEEHFTDARELSADRCPALRTGSEEDLAGAILFLASRAGAYLNGECLVTDGGRLSQLPSTY